VRRWASPDEELAFYDALAQNRSAIEVMGQKELAVIATELVKHVRRNATIDWTVKQSARAKMRVLASASCASTVIPPYLQEAATQTVLEQAELLAAEWAMWRRRHSVVWNVPRAEQSSPFLFSENGFSAPAQRIPC
jgi:hypothetical protein